MFGACRGDELLNMSINDIEYLEDSIKVSIPQTKNKIIRQFVISKGEDPEVDLVHIVKKYAELRSPGTPTQRFFVSYQGQKCTKQPVGINTIRAIPKEIAQYLKLRNPESYTGHCFRRSSASLLADAGADITLLKRHGGWASDKVAEGYVVSSLSNKRKIAEKIFGSKKIPRRDEVSDVRELVEVTDPCEVVPEPSVIDSFNEQFTVQGTAPQNSTVDNSTVSFSTAKNAQYPMQFNNCTITINQH